MDPFEESREILGEVAGAKMRIEDSYQRRDWYFRIKQTQSFFYLGFTLLFFRIAWGEAALALLRPSGIGLGLTFLVLGIVSFYFYLKNLGQMLKFVKHEPMGKDYAF